MDEPQGKVTRKGVLARLRHPDKAHMARLRTHVPYWWVVAVLLAFSAWQILLDPFGFSSLTQRYTQDISNLLITGPYLYPETGRDKIAVALVEEDTLHSLDMSWPWSYGAHARALDALLALHPRAVVVDFLFVDPRPDDTLGDLVEEIHRYQKAGVPLYFTAATDVGPGEPALRAELAAAGVQLVDPTIVLNQGIARQYPTSGRCYGTRGTCRSLALTVYGDLFPEHKLPQPGGMMEIVWGTKVDPFNEKPIKAVDENGTALTCRNDMSFWRRTWLAFFSPATVQVRCPYDGIIPVASLMRGDDDSDIAQFAKDRIIFYGGQLEGAQDIAVTPVNGIVGGVFVHAMALDNLITFEGRPQEDVVHVGAMTMGSNPAQVLAIIPVILILAWIHIGDVRRRARASSGERSALWSFFAERATSLFWHLLAFVLALGAGLALSLALGLSVANWVEVVFVSIVLAGMLLFAVPDAIWGYLHHVAIGQPEES
jgi:hypothetical protein